MSEVYISPAVRDIGRIAIEAFSEAQDEIAEDIARGWRAQVISLDVIDTETYLHAISVGDTREGVSERVVTVEAPAARGYSDVQERGRKPNRSGRGGYAGRYPAKRGLEATEPDIRAELDKAGRKVQKG